MFSDSTMESNKVKLNAKQKEKFFQDHKGGKLKDVSFQEMKQIIEKYSKMEL
jgi:hypothetical protein